MRILKATNSADKSTPEPKYEGISAGLRRLELSYIDDTGVAKPNSAPTVHQKNLENVAYKNPKKAYNSLVKDLRGAKHFKKDYAYIKVKNTGHGGGHRLHIMHVPTLHKELHRMHAAYKSGGETALKKAVLEHARSKSGHGHAGHVRMVGDQVGMATLHKEHTKKGVMHDLYHHLVTKEGKKLRSSSQSKGARALWTKLSKHKDLQVHALVNHGDGVVKLKPGLTHASGHSVYDKKHKPNKDVYALHLSKKK